MPAFECRRCDPGCYLECSEEDIRVPEQCPWKECKDDVCWKEVL